MKHAVLLALVAMSLGGCVSSNLSIRSVAPEDPASENAAAVASAVAFAAAETQKNRAESQSAAASKAGGGGQDTDKAVPPVTPAEAPSMYSYDPWERLNRFTYRFNTRFDEAIFLPVTDVYRRVPSPLRAGVHNFFANLKEVDSIVNYTLQWRLKLGLRTLGRFAINSTVGIGGLFDPAAKMKLPAAPTGMSTTLAKWGMHPGPYLVIPILGPSTLRDGIGYLGDYGVSYIVNVADLYRGWISWGLPVVDAVDIRSNVNFRYYGSGSPFEYEYTRFLYVHKRLIEDQGLRGSIENKSEKSSTPRKRDAQEPAGK